MNVFMLYLVLLKASITSFSGLAAIPIIREALVIHAHVLSDAQLNEAVVISRSTPGPVAIYLVSIGYFVAGVGGAVAGWLAMITPALLVIPLIHFAGKKAENPRVKEVIKSIMIASAAMLFLDAIPLAQNAIFDVLTACIAFGSFVLLILDLIEVHWLMLAGVALTLIQYYWPLQNTLGLG